MNAFKGLLFFSMVIILTAAALQAEKLHTFPDLFDPFHMQMDDRHMYISQKTTILVYSRENFKLVTKFGKPGEGRGEMMPFANMGIMFFLGPDNTLTINAQGKILTYTRGGKFIEELPNKNAFNQIPLFQPYGDKLVGVGIAIGTDAFYYTFNLYDQELNSIKEFGRKAYMKPGGMEMPQDPPLIYVYQDKIILPGGDGFHIDVRDAENKTLTSIKRETKPVPVTEEYKKGLFRMFKKIMAPGQVEAVKRLMTFKKEFPPLMSFYPEGGHVYAATHRKEGNKYEFFVYTLKGEFVKRSMIPFYFIDGARANAWTIYKGVFYQLVENVEDQSFELYSYKF